MISFGLADADKAALVALLKQAIAADPFPLSHRTRAPRSILAKLTRRHRDRSRVRH